MALAAFAALLIQNSFKSASYEGVAAVLQHRGTGLYQYIRLLLFMSCHHVWSVDLVSSSLVHGSPLCVQDSRCSIFWKCPPCPCMVFLLLEDPHSYMLSLVLSTFVQRWFSFFHVSQSSCAPGGRCWAVLIFIPTPSLGICSHDWHSFIHVDINVSSSDCTVERTCFYVFSLLGPAM